MYLEPCCKVQIGDDKRYLEFNSVNKIRIEQSVKDLGDSATITLPRNYRKLNGKSVLDLMKSGDPVKIWMGYDGNLKLEFSGYLQYIESGAPLVLHVDDEFYPLKRNSFLISWKAITLEDLLKHIAPGYKISCPSTNLGAFQISNSSTYRVLTVLKQQYGFYSFIRDKVLICQLPYEVKGTGNIHTYQLYTPSVKKNSLKYSRAEDKKIRVRVTSNQRDGKKLKYETGAKKNEGSLHEATFPPMTLSELKVFAESWYKTLSYDGYRGSITGFGTPLTNAGDTLRIIDPDEPSMDGNYLIESIVKTYDLTVGYERENTISFKV